MNVDLYHLFFLFVVASFVGLNIGVCIGVQIAERHAVQHSDCATAHHMQGRFYYIVPESEYVKLIRLKYQRTPWEESEDEEEDLAS